MQKVWESYGDLVLKRRLEGKSIRGLPLELLPTPQARNSEPFDNRPACAGNSICVPICPIQAKYDATVHVNKALKAKAELQPRAVVTDFEAGTEGRVTTVRYIRWNANPDEVDEEASVKGRIVVLAAHAIESAKLLLLSNLANRSGQVGRNLMDHLQGYGGAIMPEPMFPFRGPPTTSGIDVFRDATVRCGEAAFRMSMGNDGWGRQEAPYQTVSKLVREQKIYGRELKRRIEDRVTRMFRISYSTEQLPEPDNRVELSSKKDALGLPRPKISYHVRDGDYNRRGFRSARLAVEQIFKFLEAEETAIRYADDKGYSGAGHIMGTCRMGHDPETSVVDGDCRAHDHPNLFVVGAAVFPTGGTANPTLTVAALAMRAADAIERQLAREK
jgi:choline dehydrogenase-like flavoprotein